ncbi:MAG: hypothetical protein JRH19_24715 [Deltaproteobacteria bacterium]|nr:hypothetical protein [Deltaproteobacteria bacterium]
MTRYLSIHEVLALHERIAAQERVVLAVAAGELAREQLTDWLREHLRSV